MTRNDILEMAHEAGLVMPTGGATENQWRAFEIFAKLSAELERKACAEVCDNQMEWGIISPQMKVSAGNCADLIRARGQQ
jgi:hypothetical protein